MHSSPGTGLGRRLLALALMGSFAAAGCGGGTGTVTGKVYYKDTPLKGGNVTFVSTQGKPSKSASIGEDGSYKLEKVPAGEVKICVETQSLRPQPGATAPERKSTPPPGAKGPSYASGGGGAAADTSKRYVAIPDDYADPKKTKLTYKVTGGNQEHNIKLD